MLVDHAIIFVRSGKGGDGAISFRREKYIPKGGPDGGNGGDGGDVILVADPQMSTLMDFQGKRHWRAQHADNGGRKQCFGKDGEDLRIHLPPGTLVYDDETGELIVDLDTDGMEFLVCKGGRGGFGNEHYKTPVNQTPMTATPGEPAVEKTLRLELKLIADVGIVGMPNAGKSTLLSRVSKAHPKIAAYPFTTLEPELGIAELTGYRRLVIADIPGLIEGASEGTGLGHEFLRHVERTRILVHLLDIDPIDGSDPVENYHIIRKELSAYSELLANKPEIVVASKLDMMPDEGDRATALDMIEAGIGQRPMTISSASGEGLQELLEKCWVMARKDEETQAEANANANADRETDESE